MYVNILSLAAIMAFRVFGLFMVLPVFTPAAMTLTHATAARVGIALGIYGFAQACLQLPLGKLSDRIGRKKVIFLGLLLFLAGSLIAAHSHSIFSLTAGRALQGAGAIGSTILAFIADLTPEKDRGKAMAMIGMFMGFSFCLAFILGPIIFHWYGLRGIFYATSFFALIGLGLLSRLPKTTQEITIKNPLQDCSQEKLTHPTSQTLSLQPFYFSAFFLHFLFTLLFLFLPKILKHEFAFSTLQQAGLYSTLLILSFIAMLPLLLYAEKKKKIKPTLLFAISLLCCSELLLRTLTTTGMFLTALLLFFAAFNLLEALLPSNLSKRCPTEHKGRAMGIYSTAQYSGTALGGVVGGWLLYHAPVVGLYTLITIAASAWTILVFKKLT